MEVSEEGVFVPRKGEDRYGHRDADVDAHHAGVGLAGKLPGIVAVLGKDAGTVGKFAGVHDGQPLFEILHPLDAGNRPEDLFVPHAHAGLDVIEDGGADEVAPLKSRNHYVPAVKDKFGPFFCFTPLLTQSMTNFLCSAETTGPSSVSG